MQKKILVAIVVFHLAVPFFAFSQVMESTSYKIRSDSVNFGGGLGTSVSYTTEDSVGEIATGPSESSTYRLRAGYQQMQETSIAITSPADIAMSALDSSGGVSNASATWTVTTDDPAGYTLSIRASTDPALTSGPNSFADYTPALTDPDYDFSVAASDSEFGYSPEGTDVVTRFLDNSASCNAGAGNTADKCWDGLTMLNSAIAASTASNHITGTATTVKFRAEIGASKNQSAGSYTATITVTAVTL